MIISNSNSVHRDQDSANQPDLSGEKLQRNMIPEYLPLSSLSPEQLRTFCHKLPKIELHQHLEGSFTADMLLELADVHGLELPTKDPESLKSFLQVDPDNASLVEFLEKFKTIGTLFVSPEAISDLTYATIKKAAELNVIHLELRYSPSYMAICQSLSLEEVSDSVLAGVERAKKDFGISVSLIAIVERQMSIDTAESVIDHAIAYKGNGIAAVDLANDEANFPPAPFAPIFQKAKNAGLSVTVHAGEAAGPENIRTAIEELKADRIGHGVRLMEDPELLKTVSDKQITLELCYTSNYQTGAISEEMNFPLRLYYAAGIPVSVNTDDPGVCGVNQIDEWQNNIIAGDFSFAEVKSILEGCIESAFLDQEEKQNLRRIYSQKLAEVHDWLVSTVSPAQTSSE